MLLLIGTMLKQKSRLAGELVRLQQILTRETARRSDSVTTVNREEIWNQIVSTSNQLGTLKGQITIANIGIYPTLESMSELKSRIAYINGLNKRVGTEIEPSYGNNERITHTWESYITQEKADAMVVDLQAQINAAQDAVDAYNSNTDI